MVWGKRALPGSVREFESGSRFVEIGAWRGQSTAFMSVDTWKGSTEHHDVESNSFDPYLAEHGNLFPLFKENLSPVWKHINAIQNTSVEAAKLFEDESLDFVYVGGAHDYESVQEDIEAQYSKVGPNGMLAGDDYAYPGVEQAVKEAFGDNFMVEADNNWIHSKKKDFSYDYFAKVSLRKRGRLQKIIDWAKGH